MADNNDSLQSPVEKYLSLAGVRHAKFVIIDNRTGLFIDYAYSIRERNEKIRNLKGYPWNFDIRWDFYASIIREANSPFKGRLVYRGLYYTMELNVAREGYPEYFQRAGVFA